MKVLIAIGIYLFFTVALGVVMATMPPRWLCEDDRSDEEN
jgi:hypothetical protein